MLPVNTGFEVYMFGSGTTGTSCQPDSLSGFYDITSFNQILEIVAIKCFQSVSVADYNDIAIGIIGFRHTHHSIKSSTNRIFCTGLNVCSRMSSASSIGRDYFSSG